MSDQGVMIGKPVAMLERPSSGAGDAWVILPVVFLANGAGSLHQGKPPPLTPVLMAAFRIAYDRAKDRGQRDQLRDRDENQRR